MAKIPKTMFITRNEAIIILAKYKSGRIFTVTFVKRTNGQTRVMNCRRGVKKGQAGRGLSFSPIKRGLVSVYDMKKADYRFISLEGVTKIVMNGMKYIVR